MLYKNIWYKTHTLKNNTKMNTCVIITHIKNQNIASNLDISYMSLLSPSSTHSHIVTGLIF